MISFNVNRVWRVQFVNFIRIHTLKRIVTMARPPPPPSHSWSTILHRDVELWYERLVDRGYKMFIFTYDNNIIWRYDQVSNDTDDLGLGSSFIELEFSYHEILSLFYYFILSICHRNPVIISENGGYVLCETGFS